MNLDGARYDAVVIGGGFAGVVAARDLTEQGNTVLLLEARDRLGGRTYGSTYPGTDLHVELGGQFFLPGVNVELEAEMERYGLETQWLPESDSYPTILNGKRNAGPFPVPIEQMFDLERAAVHCILASARITPGVPVDQQDVADLDIPMSEFLAPLELPAETYEFVTTFNTMFACRNPEDSSALQFLTILAIMGNSPLTMWGALGAAVDTSELLDRMSAEVTEVRLGSPVVKVDQTGGDVLVTTAAGETISAAGVVVATPVNIWNDIEFAPQLSEEKRVTSAERHGTDLSRKVLMRVRNSPGMPFLLASPQSTGGPFGTFTEHVLDNGDQLVVLFAQKTGDAVNAIDYDDHDALQGVLQMMLPGAELLDFLTHDYNVDPYSKGDWISWRPGRVSKSHSALAAPEGRLAFATADIAPKSLMLIEGAVEGGHQAARQTLNHLVREREAAVVRER